MYNEETNHYYVDLDGIRLVFEDGKLVIQKGKKNFRVVELV